jgi:hypothetical protein
MRPWRAVSFFPALLVLGGAALAAADAPSGLPGVGAKIKDLDHRVGLLTLDVDVQRGKVWLEVPPAAAGKPSGGAHLDGEIGRYVYVEGIVTGLGSNPVGLDRGQLGETEILRLRRLGGRVLAELLNTRFRALSADPAESQSVAESFATSVLWAGEIAAEDPDGRALVDFTSFVTRDAHGIVGHLKQAGQGSWSLDGARSAVDPEQCLVFPENVELEALLTYTSGEPGREVRSTAPSAGAMTLVGHQTLLKLPDDNYKPRHDDPRMGSFPVSFLNYSAPLGSPNATH